MRNAPQLLRGFILVIVAILSVNTAASAAATDAPAAATEATAEGLSDPGALQQAIDAYRAGAPLRALDAFLQIARANPTMAEPMIWAGIAATAGYKYQEAEAYFREALQRPHTEFQDRITQGWLSRLSVLRDEGEDVFRALAGTPQAIAALARASNPRLTWKEAARIGQYVVSAAQGQGVDPWLLAALVYIESGFNHGVVSRRGARGLGQLMPQTARAAGVDLRDPWGNLLGAAMTLRANYLEFHDWRLALAAYNAGTRAVRRYRGVPPFAETRWYVMAVWAVYNRIRPQS